MLDALSVWVTEHRLRLEADGLSVKFGRTSDERPKHSCTLHIDSTNAASDLVVWDSGEADLSLLSRDGLNHYEYLVTVHDVDSVLVLLERMLENVRGTVHGE